MFADREIKRLVERDHDRTFDGKFQNIPVKFGQIEYGGIFAGGMYGIGLLSRMDGLRTTGRLLIQSLVYSGSTVMILRWAFGRTRPFLTDNSWNFNWFEPRFRMQAFPSGHATVSFTISTILSNRINNTFVTTGLFGIAILDGFYQVYAHQHWLSDIIIGSALGLGASLYVISQEEKRTGNFSQKDTGFKIIPNIGGIQVVYQF
jgi:membrane-associated phospholipid phosphatase